jgi:phosphotransferase system  glucose/maltose/N-acetylglucosamine-specific IIC component
MRTMKREPVVIINAVVTAIQASIPLVLAFGIAHMTREEGAAISSAVVAWGGLLATFLGRSLVTPVAYPKDHEGRSLRAGAASTSADKERPIPARHQQIKNGQSLRAG